MQCYFAENLTEIERALEDVDNNNINLKMLLNSPTSFQMIIFSINCIHITTQMHCGSCSWDSKRKAELYNKYFSVRKLKFDKVIRSSWLFRIFFIFRLYLDLNCFWDYELGMLTLLYCKIKLKFTTLFFW